MEETNYRLLVEELNRHDNLELTRNFTHERLEMSRNKLLSIAQEELMPRDSLNISVVGSNGKGSTSYFLAGFFQRHDGLRGNTGLFTSPHLLRVTERIRVNLRDIEAGRALEELARLREITGEMYDSFSYFELLTLLACILFKYENCTTQIFEAGLGGRFDATLVCRPQIVILTAVELEHTKILGNNHEAILSEKLGIINDRTDRVFCMPQRYINENIIRNTINNSRPEIEISFFNKNLNEGSYLDYNKDFAAFVYDSVTEKKCDPSLSAVMPGRMERHTLKAVDQFGSSLELLFDPAHNPFALKILLNSIVNIPGFPGVEKTLILTSMMPDRNIREGLVLARQMGFPVRQILSDFLAPLETGFEGWKTEEISEKIPIALREGFELIVMAGSNYLYKYFLEILGRAKIHSQE